MILEQLEMGPEGFTAVTGWELKAEGACRGDVCVPLPEAAYESGSVSVPSVARRLGMPLLHDEVHDVWALGPASLPGRVLTTAEAPELTLPDLEGRPYDLAGLRGQKALLAAWASW